MKKNNYAMSQIIIHWVMFFVILLCASAIELRELFEKGTDLRSELRNAHMWLGQLVLLLAFFRLLLRVGFGQPNPISEVNWQVFFMKFAHYCLYILMLLIPILGIMIVQAAGKEVSFLGFVLPEFVAPDKGFRKLIKSIHEIFANVFYLLIGLHVLAAFWHHYIVKDDVLQRMRFSK